MFSALVQYFLFPQYSEKAGKLQHMCNRPISLYNTLACVISALHRSPWGSTQNHTLSALLHNQQCLFLLDLFLLSHHSPFLKLNLLNLAVHSSASHFSFCIAQTHWQIHFWGLPARFTRINNDCQGITGTCRMYFNKQAHFTVICMVHKLFVSIMHVTCRKGCTHGDNLPTDSNGLMSGKC